MSQPAASSGAENTSSAPVSTADSTICSAQRQLQIDLDRACGGIRLRAGASTVRLALSSAASLPQQKSVPARRRAA